MKRQRSATFVKKKFKDKYINDKKHHIARDHCHYTGKYRGAAPSICNLKCSVPKEESAKMEKRLQKPYNTNSNLLIA